MPRVGMIRMSTHFHKIACLAFLLAFAGSVRQVKAADFIDWQGLHNPVLAYPNWSIKDSAMDRHVLAGRPATHQTAPRANRRVLHVVERCRQ
ncbi:MAG TPA: hypothetical protein VGL97_20280 [Bryobacteraceae bacterium]